jgi:hypothetical protein
LASWISAPATKQSETPEAGERDRARNVLRRVRGTRP